jgi:hypothetical protein
MRYVPFSNGTSFAGDPILPILYTNYVATDFNGGVENLGGIIIEPY